MTTDNKALAERLDSAWRKLYDDGDEHCVCDVIGEAVLALRESDAPTASPQVDEGLTDEDWKWIRLIRQELFHRLDVASTNKAGTNINARITALDKLVALTHPQPQGDASGQVSGGGECNCPNGRAEHAPGCAALSPTQARPDDGAVVEKPCKECGATVHVWANEANPICFGCYADLPAPTADGGAVAWCALNAGGGIAYFDGKPMIMVGAVGNVHHTVPMFLHPAPKAEVARLVEAAKFLLDEDDLPVIAGLASLRDALLPFTTAQKERK